MPRYIIVVDVEDGTLTGVETWEQSGPPSTMGPVGVPGIHRGSYDIDDFPPGTGSFTKLEAIVADIIRDEIRLDS